MNLAVINTGGKQYLVKEGQELWVDIMPGAKKALSFAPLLVIEGKSVLVGTPEVKNYTVKADLVEPIVKGTKLRIVKFKPKKRVSVSTGHRQKHSLIKITTIGK